MEYYIYCTYRCNLNCSFCCAKRVVTPNESHSFDLTGPMLDKTIEYINNDIAARKNPKNWIIFFGGEPTLVQNVMSEIIHRTNHTGAKYVLYTNGTKLTGLPCELLQKLYAVFVSIDGERDVHDRHRGAGIFDLMIGEVRKLRGATPPLFVGRMTVEEDTDACAAVQKCLTEFDAVHYQIVNKAKFNNGADFVCRYGEDVRRLVGWWVGQMAHGRLERVVPLMVVSRLLLWPEKEVLPSFRCGSGWGNLNFGIDGKIYECDENVNVPEAVCGDVTKQTFVAPNPLSHKDLFKDCIECNISEICRGRCRRLLSSGDTERIRVYCGLTHGLVDALKDRKEEIGDLAQKHNWTEEDFLRDTPCTEEIP